MFFVARQTRNPPDRRPSLFIAYMFWLLAGFLGIHRFYLRSGWGFVFIPVFLAILYCNGQIREVRDDESRTFAALQQAQYAAELVKPKTDPPSPEAAKEYADAQANIAKLDADYQVAKGVRDHWKDLARAGAIALAIMLLVDAMLLPGLVRRRRALELAEPDSEVAHAEPPAVARRRRRRGSDDWAAQSVDRRDRAGRTRPLENMSPGGR